MLRGRILRAKNQVRILVAYRIPVAYSCQLRIIVPKLNSNPERDLIVIWASAFKTTLTNAKNINPKFLSVSRQSFTNHNSQLIPNAWFESLSDSTDRLR